ncbi:MAG TPA: thiamine phosphate synthase [Xanthobacteraceae bacterium]|nr:thiamine phosphate synthase [Xanthobacteraceae bacterium]
MDYSRDLPNPPLLVITDRQQAKKPLEEIVGVAFAAGCRWASIREKDLPPQDQVALASRLREVAQSYGAVVTLHGEPELARAAGVAGVHLSAGSDVHAARRLLGREALVGISVHSRAEAERLDGVAIDYMVAGPAFETASKPGYGPGLGIEGIAEIARATRIPLIAIGGVSADGAAAILRAGAAGVAVMGGIMRCADPAAAIQGLLAALRGFQGQQ